RQPAELARHVVGGRCDRAERRPAYNDLGVAKADQIGQIRMSAGELPDLRIAREIQTRDVARLQTIAQPSDEPRPIELFARAHRPYVLNDHLESHLSKLSTTEDVVDTEVFNRRSLDR